jgi:uncharacterized protein
MLLAAMAVCFVASDPLSDVLAQQQYQYQYPQQRRSLFDIIFGIRRQEYPPAEPPPPRRVVRPVPRKRTIQPGAPGQPRVMGTQAGEPQPVEKLDTAKTILVVGDFLASGLGDGLETAFAASPGVVVATRGTVASGLVRRDYYNWQEVLPQMITDAKPAMVVVMIGANDRQQIVDDTLKEKYGTDVWFMAYEARVLEFAKQVTSRNIPLVWVSLPPFESDAMTADASRLNQLYRKQVESVGGQFIDIWDGFADEDGKFITTGSDINGQQARLRTSDGINLTPAGRRKVAFYVEKPIRHLLGDQASPDISRLGADKNDAGLPPSETNQPLRTQPISLSDPDLDGGKELLGAKVAPPPTGKSPRDLLVEKGEMAPAPAGRVDNYSLPDAKAAP